MKILLAVSICLAVTCVACTQQAADKTDGTKFDYRKVIQGLVSPNKPIVISDNDKLRYPPVYDMDAQELIVKNRQMLYKNCEEALPFMIEACTDPRYSLTWKSDSYAQNMCVGEVCLEIVAAHLEVYREYMPSLLSKEEYYGYRFVPRINGAIGEKVTQDKKKEIEDWWRDRKGKTLLDLQIEAFDWALEKRQKDIELAFDKSKATAEIERVIAVCDKLKQDRKCLPPDRLYPPVTGSGIKTSDK